MRELTISVYFLYEWWNKYFHNTIPRPQYISDDNLDMMYLNRKRFLFDEFGQFDIGEENPVMDGDYVNIVTKYGMDLIPYLYGANLTCQAVGGWMPDFFSRDALSRMEPVDIAKHPFAEWFLNTREQKIKRYGSVKAFLDYESPTNIAVRLRGEEFYSDLLEDPEFSRHVLELSTAAIEYIFKFLDTFPVMPKEKKAANFSIGNCNVTMISEGLYTELIKPFDIRLINRIEELTGRTWTMQLHHCDVPVDRFLDAYKDLPRLTALQASHSTDIQAVREKMPGVSFQSMISPLEMMGALEELEKKFDRAIRLGSTELDFWNIDPAVSPEKLRAMFTSITKSANAYNVTPVFSVIPFVWDELEWAYPQYQEKKRHEPF
ncbi:MAG: uroporphyrinogen decarboxylase family protein [Treponema sp.]|jgi:hypothetical protein|nr:uroporphyrinogen decarboxylase family protein [Treponema sp.]